MMYFAVEMGFFVSNICYDMYDSMNMVYLLIYMKCQAKIEMMTTGASLLTMIS